jgi:hypothetical protein
MYVDPWLLHVISPVARNRIPDDLATFPSNNLGWDMPLSNGSSNDFVYTCNDPPPLAAALFAVCGDAILFLVFVS